MLGTRGPRHSPGRDHRGEEQQTVVLGAGWVGAGEDPSLGVPPKGEGHTGGRGGRSRANQGCPLR